MKSKPEILFSKLLYRKIFFEEFNWIYLFHDSVPLKNINNNKYYQKYKKVYSYICDKYPLQTDINNFVNGFFLNNNNIYKINFSEISSIMTKWNYLERNYKLIIKADSIKLKEYLLENNLNLDKILVYKDTVPIIYTIYKKGIISKLTLGYIYYSNKEQLKQVINDSLEQNKSIEKSLFLSEVYKSYKIFKLIMLQKRKGV